MVEQQRVPVVGDVEAFVLALVIGAPVLALGGEGPAVDAPVVEYAVGQGFGRVEG